MVRHGMITIGVAVQAETFSNNISDNNAGNANAANGIVGASSINANLGNSGLTSSKSAIFLPPSRNGAPQTLKITFAYNKDTNLPEVTVNLNDEGEDQYLKLKELASQQQGTHEKYLSLVGESSTSSSKSKAKSSSSKDSSNAVQVYYFEDKMDKPYATEVFDVTPMISVTEPQTSPKAIEDGGFKEKLGQVNTKTEKDSSSDKNTKDMDKGQGQCEKNQDEITKSPKKSVGSPIKKSGSKKVLIKDGKENNEKTQSPKNNSSEEVGGGGKASSKSNGRLGGRRKSKTKSLEKDPSVLSFEEDGRAASPSKSIGDRSKIPVINSSATGFMPCEYYRQKWLQEQGCLDPSSWNNYSTMQKTAGQKVVNKMTAQQKKLEEDAAAHRKRTEFVFQDEMGICEVPQFIPIRKKQTRLEPLRQVPKCH